MGRAIILIVLGSSIIFTLTSSHMGVITTEGVQIVADNYKQIAARSIAKEGVDLCIMQLDSARTWRTGYSHFPISGGMLNAVVSTVDLERVRIQSTGRYMDQSVTVTCVVRIPPSDVPAAFDHALASDGPLTLNGTVNVLLEDSSLQANASVLSNNTINTGTQVQVQGFGYSHGSITCNPLSDLPNVFRPHYNPNGMPPYNDNYPRISLPDFNADTYKSIATDVYEGDFNLNGNIDYGSYDVPKIVWIGGNMRVSGGVQLTGAIIFIVRGDITINGGIDTPGAGSLSTVGFYSGRDITVNGNPSIAGQFYARSSFVANGNPSITGNVIVKNNQLSILTLNGTATVSYRGANPILTRPIWETSPRPEIDSYWE